MKRLGSLVVLALASAGWVVPQAPPPSDAERKIASIHHSGRRSDGHPRFRAALERLHAATFTAITPTGAVYDRAGWIDLVAQGGLAVQKTDDEEQFEEDLTMHASGIAARTTFARFRFSSRKRDVAMKNRIVYARLDGEWRVISSQASLLHDGPLIAVANDAVVGRYALDNGRTVTVTKSGRTFFATLPTLRPARTPIFETAEGHFIGAGGFYYAFIKSESKGRDSGTDPHGRIAAVTLTRDGKELWRATRVE